MSDSASPELPEFSAEPTPPGLPPPELLPPPPPERVPFWGYRDLAVFVGLFIGSLIIAFLLTNGAMAVLHLNPANDLWRLLPAQFLAYILLFLAVWLMFRAQYDRPFWHSLGWINLGLRPTAIIAYGVLLAFTVGVISQMLRTPDVPTPMSKMLSDRASIVLVAAFGATLGPLCEELIFRGFMQPLFVRSLGAVGGILAAAVPFGLLHVQEYGNSWRHGLLITMAGAAFGWMRWRTSSTKASTLMHAAYNGTFFIALLMQPKNLPH
jgi:membrane protease YdiL (CAAX protease family)